MSTPKIYTVHGSTVVEWTPSFVLTRSRSLWPDNPRGKPLTNRRILQYERDGRYGPDAQRRHLEADREKTLTAQRRRVKAVERRNAAEREARESQRLVMKYV